MNRNQRVVMFFGLLVLSALALGCANNSSSSRADIPAYERDIARARASLAEAEQAGAADYGNAQLALARDKLRAAEQFADDGETERARRLAVEADLDADLAVAITRNRQTQQLATEVRSGLQTLEEELRRAQTTDTVAP
jgi:hypothetical protein